MAITHRVRRLERDITVPGGGRRCAACGDGTRPTGILVRVLGVAREPIPAPCPGCGRDEPTEINIRAAEAPPGYYERNGLTPTPTPVGADSPP